MFYGSSWTFWTTFTNAWTLGMEIVNKEMDAYFSRLVSGLLVSKECCYQLLIPLPLTLVGMIEVVKRAYCGALQPAFLVTVGWWIFGTWVRCWWMKCPHPVEENLAHEVMYEENMLLHISTRILPIFSRNNIHIKLNHQFGIIYVIVNLNFSINFDFNQ